MTLNTKLKSLLKDNVQCWLHEQPALNIVDFLLHPPDHLADIRKEVAEQLQAREKAKKKLPNWHQTKGIVWPPPLSIEQASSEQSAFFKSQFLSGKKLTDLTGGTGIDAFAFSKKFQEVEFVEQDEWLCSVFSNNIQVTGVKNIRVKRAKAEDIIQDIEVGQDVFLDPARRDHSKNKVFKLEDCSPNLLEIIPALRKKKVRTMVKLSPMLDISQLIQHLHPHRIIIVSIDNECKELLAIITHEPSTDPVIQTFNLNGNSSQEFEFRFSEESTTNCPMNSLQNYVYEPNASILKAGAFQLVGAHYQLTKIAKHTHLYTSDELNMNFPGRIFEINEIVNAKELKRKYQKTRLNVIARNYPQNASQITRQYQLIESGEQYLIAFQDDRKHKNMILTTRINTSQNVD